ncbi:MAG: hypothetical protein ACW9W3_05730 [Candidatus Nitrosopumilus sp. bin_68KS]
MKTRLLIIIGMAVFAGVGIAYGINQYDYYQDQKQYEEWRDIRESILSEIRESKNRNQTVQTTDVGSMSDEEQCAWTFDNSMNEFVREQEKYNDSHDAVSKPISEDQIVSTSIQFAKWRSMGCAFSISEWAYLSTYEEWAWENIAPTYKIRGLHSRMLIDEPIFVTVEKIGYHMCDSWNAKIIDLANNSTVWDKQSHSLCVVADNHTQKSFQYTISNEINPIVISILGNYTFQIDIGPVYLEKDFTVIEEFEDIVVYDEWDR